MIWRSTKDWRRVPHFPLPAIPSSGRNGRDSQLSPERAPPGLARVPGFEPGAYRLGGGRSIQLSYTR